MTEPNMAALADLCRDVWLASERTGETTDLDCVEKSLEDLRICSMGAGWDRSTLADHERARRFLANLRAAIRSAKGGHDGTV